MGLCKTPTLHFLPHRIFVSFSPCSKYQNYILLYPKYCQHPPPPLFSPHPDTGLPSGGRGKALLAWTYPKLCDHGFSVRFLKDQCSKCEPCFWSQMKMSLQWRRETVIMIIAADRHWKLLWLWWAVNWREEITHLILLVKIFFKKLSIYAYIVCMYMCACIRQGEENHSGSSGLQARADIVELPSYLAPPNMYPAPPHATA